MARIGTTSRRANFATWTRFRLSQEQNWPPQWPNLSDTQRGVFEGVDGCLSVSVGRRIDDPENVAIIAFWRSEEAITAFYNSPAYNDYILSLGCSKDTPFMLLRYLSLGNLVRNLEGLVTLFKMIPCSTEVEDSDFYEALENATCSWAPPGCDTSRGLRRFFCRTWVREEEIRGNEESTVATENGTGKEVLYHIFHWSRNCASPEQELANANDPATLLSWTAQIMSVKHVVKDLNQELWQIKRSPWPYVRGPQEYLEASESMAS